MQIDLGKQRLQQCLKWLKIKITIRINDLSSDVLGELFLKVCCDAHGRNRAQFIIWDTSLYPVLKGHISFFKLVKRVEIWTKLELALRAGLCPTFTGANLFNSNRNF